MKNLSRAMTDFSLKKSHLSPDPLHEAEFATQQRQWLQTEEAERQLNYWKQQLVGISSVLQLPTDRPRPVVQSFRAGYYTFQIPLELIEVLRAMSQKEGVTLFTILLAAVNTLLFRYTQQDDISVGIPVANRMQSELEGLTSNFSNALVLRTSMSGNPHFVEVIKRVRKVVSEAYAHQDIPFERLVEEIQPERDLSSHPLFQVMVVMKDAPMELPELPDITISPLQIDSNTTPFDITFEFSENAEGLIGHLTYKSDLFNATTIARFAGHLQTLLKSIVAQPEHGIATLPLLTETERQQLLVEWNDTQQSYPRDTCIHQLFEAQVRRVPDAIAVMDEQCELTYSELNQQANQLAHHLRGLGVGPEVLVGISLTRTVQMLVGLLAILKAGGAYVPLDPDFPAERLAYMIENAQIKILLIQDSLRMHLPVPKHVQTICIDSDWQQFAQLSNENLEVLAEPEQLAYVLYTSGSTGKPKGVQIPQRALVNFLCSMIKEPGLSEGDTLLAVTTLSFDIAGLELYLPLLVGACVAIASRDTITNGRALIHALERVKATMLQATPVTWRLLLNSGWQGKADLIALCGGEALPRNLAEQLLPRVKKLYNMYGPTETTIWSTLNHIQSAASPISIGRPIANTQVYVLDTDLQPAPIGVANELYIGGDGVARGYLHLPELTRERFLTNPFSSMSTQFPTRMYRTGDLVRYLPDGSLEHLGRLDNQVKIRGFRIEIGEIEGALGQHPAIQECVVKVQDDAQGNKLLVAYAVTKDTSTPTINDLRRFLKEQLPDYMLPSTFVPLEAFPLTPNGKIDRKALPVVDVTDIVRDGTIATPNTTTEKRLVAIVAPLLSLEQVGIDDNFFLIGGNSLMGMQLFTQLSDVFGVDFPLRTLFDAPTIRQLAAEIDRFTLAKLRLTSSDMAEYLLSHSEKSLQVDIQQVAWARSAVAQDARREESRSDAHVLVVQTGGSQRPFFFLHGQWEEGKSFHCYPLAQTLGSDQPFYGLDPYPLDGRQDLPSLEDIAAAHIKAMRAIQPEGPYLLAGWCNGGLVAYEMARQLQGAGQVVDLLVLMDPDPLVYPVTFRSYRTTFNLLGRLLRFSQVKQLDWYLRLKHLSRLLHSHLRRREDADKYLTFADLSQNYPRLFDWIALGYTPSSLYTGKVTFFWTSDDHGARASRKGWSTVESSDEAEVYFIPGDHITSRTIYLHVLAEHLESCIRRAQTSVVNGNR